MNCITDFSYLLHHFELSSRISMDRTWRLEQVLIWYQSTQHRLPLLLFQYEFPDLYLLMLCSSSLCCDRWSHVLVCSLLFSSCSVWLIIGISDCVIWVFLIFISSWRIQLQVNRRNDFRLINMIIRIIFIIMIMLVLFWLLIV